MVVKLYRGLSKKECEAAKLLKFNNVSWWTNHYIDTSHYNEGTCLVITIELENDIAMNYIDNKKDLKNNYTWGKAEIEMPPSTWYSFSRAYLKTHIISIKEIPPSSSTIYD